MPFIAGKTCRQQAYMSRKNISAMQREEAFLSGLRLKPNQLIRNKRQVEQGHRHFNRRAVKARYKYRRNKTEKVYYSSFVDYIGNTVNSENQEYFLAAFNYYAIILQMGKYPLFVHGGKPAGHFWIETSSPRWFKRHLQCLSSVYQLAGFEELPSIIRIGMKWIITTITSRSFACKQRMKRFVGFSKTPRHC